MQITIVLTAEEQDAVEFLIKLRNMTEYADAEAFFRGLVANAVNGAVSELKAKKKADLVEAMEKLSQKDIEDFFMSRQLVK